MFDSFSYQVKVVFSGRDYCYTIPEHKVRGLNSDKVPIETIIRELVFKELNSKYSKYENSNQYICDNCKWAAINTGNPEITNVENDLRMFVNYDRGFFSTNVSESYGGVKSSITKRTSEVPKLVCRETSPHSVIQPGNTACPKFNKKDVENFDVIEIIDTLFDRVQKNTT